MIFLGLGLLDLLQVVDAIVLSGIEIQFLQVRGLSLFLSELFAMAFVLLLFDVGFFRPRVHHLLRLNHLFNNLLAGARIFFFDCLLQPLFFHLDVRPVGSVEELRLAVLELIGQVDYLFCALSVFLVDPNQLVDILHEVLAVDVFLPVVLR